jgi:hypothetical protein
LIYHKPCQCRNADYWADDTHIETLLSLTSLGPLVSYANKTDHHDVTEILLKVALNTSKQTNNLQYTSVDSSNISEQISYTIV